MNSQGWVIILIALSLPTGTEITVIKLKKAAIQCENILEKAKQNLKHKIDLEQALSLRWVVKLEPGISVDDFAEQYGFTNDGPVRELLDSFVFTLKAEHHLRSEEAVMELLSADEVLSFIPFRHDKIKEQIQKLKHEHEEQGIIYEPLSSESRFGLNQHDDVGRSVQKIESAISQLARKKKKPKEEIVVLLKPEFEGDDLAKRYGFINRGKVKESTVNNYIFRISSHVTEQEKKEMVQNLMKDDRVIDVMRFDLEELKKRRQQLLEKQQQQASAQQ